LAEIQYISNEAASREIDACVEDLRAAATAYLDTIANRRGGMRPLRGEELALKAAFCAGADYERRRGAK
jgi:hypothetical protein